MTPELVHVVFPLEVDDDDWPPVRSERVWATTVGHDEYRIENAPFFIPNIAEGDVVRALAPGDDEWPVYFETLQWSGNCTIRLIPRQDGPLRGDQASTLALFVELGATGEGAGIYPIVAITVSPDLDLPAIKALLKAGETDGRWYFEEACVGDGWENA